MNHLGWLQGADLIIMDMDGTLIRFIDTAVQRAAAGIPRRCQTPGQWSALRAIEAEAAKGARLNNGARGLLKTLWQQKRTVTLLTNNSEMAMQEVLDKTGVGSYFQSCIARDSYPYYPPKPYPAGVRHLIQKHNAKNPVMIGDSQHDIQAAHAAQIPCIILQSKHNRDQKLSGDWNITDLKQITRALKGEN